VLRQLKEESMSKWQKNWNQTTKGNTTKDYFPEIKEKLGMKLNHTGNLTTILTGHGNIKAYLDRFRISDDPECACRKGDQTTDHIIYDSAILKEERERLKAVVTKTRVWPTSKRTLIKRHYKDFSKFINSVSLEELKAE
jgi:hypothetical protein